MSSSFVATASIEIKAPTSKVWEALTNPDLIKQYLFGTKVTTTWLVGSDITYEGVWEGKAYKDKGKILEIKPQKLIVSTFWSALSGKPDLPENYQTVRYELASAGSNTRLMIIQDNNASQADADHSSQNWQMVLSGLKKLLEQ